MPRPEPNRGQVFDNIKIHASYPNVNNPSSGLMNSATQLAWPWSVSDGNAEVVRGHCDEIG